MAEWSLLARIKGMGLGGCWRAALPAPCAAFRSHTPLHAICSLPSQHGSSTRGDVWLAQPSVRRLEANSCSSVLRAELRDCKR